MEQFEIKKIKSLFFDEYGKNYERENMLDSEIRCPDCGSTDLIRISDYRKAQLFLRDTGGKIEPKKIRLAPDQRHNLNGMWWCLNCSRLC